jgi:hypothetical protein
MEGWRDPEVRLADGRACFEAALRYLSWGWSVLPLCPPDHAGVRSKHARECKSPGKAPLVYWTEYQSRLPTPAEVRAWWVTWPTANVGVALGPVSGLIAVDIDSPVGEVELTRLAGGVLPPALAFRTGKGRRLLYTIPAGSQLRTTHHEEGDARPLSFLAKGSQTVMPPSRHPAGISYVWEQEPTP